MLQNPVEFVFELLELPLGGEEYKNEIAFLATYDNDPGARVVPFVLDFVTGHPGHHDPPFGAPRCPWLSVAQVLFLEKTWHIGQRCLAFRRSRLNVNDVAFSRTDRYLGVLLVLFQHLGVRRHGDRESPFRMRIYLRTQIGRRALFLGRRFGNFDRVFTTNLTAAQDSDRRE